MEILKKIHRIKIYEYHENKDAQKNELKKRIETYTTEDTIKEFTSRKEKNNKIKDPHYKS